MNRVDDLLDAARRILASTGLPVVVSDQETDIAMDFLAERDDFMTLVDENATLIVGRLSRGPGDLDFEKVVVHLMDAVQRQLAAGWCLETAPARRRRQGTTTIR